jgi:hypothetical protein
MDHERPGARGRFASVQPMSIVRRVQRRQKSYLARLLLKTWKGEGSEDLPRFPRLWRTCAMVQELPNPGVRVFWGPMSWIFIGSS